MRDRPTIHGSGVCTIRRQAGSLAVSQRGFTLIELLVVIGVISILMALILPAVQGARESARKLHCTNNLKQIGLAFQHHHNDLKHFPTGGWDWFEPPTYLNGTAAVGDKQRAGWGFQILPYVDGQNAFDGRRLASDKERILAAVGTTNPVFFCPARRPPQTLDYADPGYLGGIVVAHALADYAASNSEGTGIVRRYTPACMSDLKDGALGTLVVAEKRLNLNFLGQWQEDDNEGYSAGWDEDTIRRSGAQPAQDHSSPSGDGGELFGSSHSGIFNALFADGSVHPVSYTIDRKVFGYLGHISDGQSAYPFP